METYIYELVATAVENIIERIEKLRETEPNYFEIDKINR